MNTISERLGFDEFRRERHFIMRFDSGQSAERDTWSDDVLTLHESRVTSGEDGALQLTTASLQVRTTSARGTTLSRGVWSPTL